jgi:hypothetical protein
MSNVTDAPKRLLSGKEIWAAPEPTDLMTWAVCPYLRDYEDCQRCPKWENDEHYGEVKRGCRISAEEACRIVQAAKAKEDANG